MNTNGRTKIDTALGEYDHVHSKEHIAIVTGARCLENCIKRERGRKGGRERYKSDIYRVRRYEAGTCEDTAVKRECDGGGVRGILCVRRDFYRFVLDETVRQCCVYSGR